MDQIELYKKFQSTEITRSLVNQMVNYLLGSDRTTSIADYPQGKALSHMENVYSSIENQINDKGLNLWGLHSGITHFTTHVKSNPKRENGLAESLMTGSSYRMAESSLNFAMNQIGLVMA